MPGVPIFVEVDATREDKDLQVCCKVVEMMQAANSGPVGLAGNIPELKSILHELKLNDLLPAIFAVNTFGLKPILPELDELMDESPVLFFRRELYAGQSGLLQYMGDADQNVLTTAAVIGKMRPRLTAYCFYGKKNADAVARASFTAITNFVNGDDFRQVEQMGARFRTTFPDAPRRA